ncbi:MAG: hypothetical protein AB7E55_06685 [Pigmentiphaga sp.]
MNEPTHEHPQDPSPELIRQAARAYYEATPGASFETVAAEFDISTRTAKRWAAADGGWQKVPASHELSAQAHAVADRLAQATETAATDEQRREVAAAVTLETAVDQRARVLEKHRTEWSVVRGLIGEAVRGRDGAKAKLAVDVGRALELTQRNERRAWGLDLPEQSDAVVVVIERE